MAVNLSPVGGVAGQFFDNNGDPLVGGKLFTYAAGTTTPQVTFTSSSGGTPNSNPIILNAGGRVPSEIWLTDGLAYKFVLYSSTDQLIGSWDNISGINSNFVNFTSSQEIQTATAGQTVFTLTTMQYQPGTNSLTVYVDGVNQYGPGALYSYVETDSTTVTFNAGLHVGAEVKFTSVQQATSSATNASQVAYTPAGSGAVTTNVQAKLRQTVSIEDFGADGTLAGDSAALKRAIAYASTNWLPVILPARRIYWDGSLIQENYVRLWGSGMPAVNDAKTNLVGGTIIEGSITCSGDYVDLRDFGVDLGTGSSAPSGDGIKCLAIPVDTGKFLHTENLIALCRSPSASVHALLFEGYDNHTGNNLHGIHGFFGVVFKTRNVQIGSIKATDNSNAGVYFKSDDIYGQCSDVQVDAIEVEGSVDYAVRLQADSALMDNIQIGKIQAKNHKTTLFVQTLNFAGAEFGVAKIGSIISENASADDVFIHNLKPGGRLDYVEIGSIMSINPAAKVVNLLNEAGAEIQSVVIGTVYASYDTSVTDTVLDGAIFIGGSVKKNTFNNVLLLVDHGRSTRLGAILYTTPNQDSIIGTRRARIINSVNYFYGFSEPTLSGSTAQVVVPVNTSGNNFSYVKVLHSSAVTITSIVYGSPIGVNRPFFPGHVLTIANGGSTNITVSNNPSGFVLNPGYGTVTLLENDVRSWVLGDDDVWRGLP